MKIYTLKNLSHLQYILSLIASVFFVGFIISAIILSILLSITEYANDSLSRQSMIIMISVVFGSVLIYVVSDLIKHWKEKKIVLAVDTEKVTLLINDQPFKTLRFETITSIRVVTPISGKPSIARTIILEDNQGGRLEYPVYMYWSMKDTPDIQVTRDIVKRSLVYNPKIDPRINRYITIGKFHKPLWGII